MSLENHVDYTNGAKNSGESENHLENCPKKPELWKMSWKFKSNQSEYIRKKKLVEKDVEKTNLLAGNQAEINSNSIDYLPNSDTVENIKVEPDLNFDLFDFGIKDDLM